MKKVRQLPAVEQRVETGAIQFGDDWPGLFIRGDQAMYLAMNIRMFLACVDKGLDAKGYRHSIERLAGLIGEHVVQ